MGWLFNNIFLGWESPVLSFNGDGEDSSTVDFATNTQGLPKSYKSFALDELDTKRTPKTETVGTQTTQRAALRNMYHYLDNHKELFESAEGMYKHRLQLSLL